jgi:hypothetical protein
LSMISLFFLIFGSSLILFAIILFAINLRANNRH